MFDPTAITIIFLHQKTYFSIFLSLLFIQIHSNFSLLLSNSIFDQRGHIVFLAYFNIPKLLSNNFALKFINCDVSSWNREKHLSLHLVSGWVGWVVILTQH